MLDFLILVLIIAVAAWLIRYLAIPEPVDKILFAVLVVVVLFALIRLLAGPPIVIIR